MHLLLYGGTFDPIHHGHLITAQSAREQLRADQVLFIPAGISPHKLADNATGSAASPEHRLAMLELALESNPHFTLDPRELDRPGPSYTYDTVAQLHAERPNDSFTWLLGADQLPKLHTWHRFKELQTLLQFAVLPRPNAPTTTQYLTLNTPHIDISATDIRRRVAAKLPIHYLLPDPVADYIHDHGLYLP